MKIWYASFIVSIVLFAAPSFGYDLQKSFGDRQNCLLKGSTIKSMIAHSCSRLLQNFDQLGARLQDDLGLYYLFRASFGSDTDMACADVTKALELLPKVEKPRKDLIPSAQRLKQSICR